MNPLVLEQEEEASVCEPIGLLIHSQLQILKNQSCLF